MYTVVQYEGDGVQTDFTFSFPYLSTSHVKVFLNGLLQLKSLNYNLIGANTIRFDDPPGANALIEIKRQTSPGDPIVDFVDASSLRAEDLDNAYLHNFYLSQEANDYFVKLVNDALIGIADGTAITATEPDEVIAALVNEMLNDAAADTLQQRVNDIDANAESILSLGENLQVQLNNLAQGTAAVVFVQNEEPVPGVGGVVDPIPDGARWYDANDSNKPYLWDAATLEWVSIEDPRIGQAVTDISLLTTSVEDNNTAILNEQQARSNADSALATTLSLIGAENAGATAFVLNTATVKVDSDTGNTLAQTLQSLQAADASNYAAINQIATIDLPAVRAKYGVSLNVNGYVTGFVQNNDGDSGAFVILADKFAIVDPSGDPSEAEYVPFEVTNGKLNMRGDVQIDGDLVVNGTLNGAKIVSGGIGTLQLDNSAVTVDKLSANAVSAEKIQANAITAGKINVSDLSAISANLGSITAGNLTLNSSGYIRGGATGYMSGSGFWMGYSSGYKFHIGNPAGGNYMQWDGSTLTVKGNLVVGDYIASDTALASANTQRSYSGSSWATAKSFKVDRNGTVRIKALVKREQGTVVDYPRYRIVRGSTVVDGPTDITSLSYVAISHDVSGISADEIVQIQLNGGTVYDSEVQSNLPSAGYVDNGSLCADVAFGSGITVTYN